MRYTQLTETDVQQMLGTIGVKSIEDLFSTIPDELRQKHPLNIPEGISELELLRETSRMAARNRGCDELTCFLGAGAYDHFIPTLVDALAGQSEFLTAYTPYQAEASQGILQLFYEFQSMICRIFGTDVANASLYEGASAAAEAVLMALSINRRRKIVLSGAVHPDIRRTLATYMHQQDAELIEIPAPEGVTDLAALHEAMNDQISAVIIQSPNFYGCIERVDRAVAVAHEHGALAIVSTDPIACGILKAPGRLDADIVIGEGQPLGIPLQYGAPYLGLMGTREQYLRKMPGRVVGMTHDTEGRRGFCLALQTREQHIKRERATSNICTNQGLFAIRASIYMAAMGKSGLREVAEQCHDNAHYAAKRIAELEGFELRFAAPFFKEFVVRVKKDVTSVLAACRKRDILAGVPLGQFSKEMSDCFMVAVTEKRTKQEIDALVDALQEA